MGFIVCCKNSTFIWLNILIYFTYNVDSNHQQQYIKNDARQHNYLVILNILIICKKHHVTDRSTIMKMRNQRFPDVILIRGTVGFAKTSFHQNFRHLLN